MTTLGPAFDMAWRRRFERFAERYSSEADVSGWSAFGLARRVDVFVRLLDSLRVPSDGSVLDLGCGAGTYGRLLAKRGLRVVSVDYSLPSLGRAVEYDAAGSCDYVAADGYTLPFRSSTFDLVVCIGVLQAVASPERVLDEAARVLRRGAVLVTEALNAHAVATRAARLHARLRRLPPRVRHYRPGLVDKWLADRGLRRFARVPIVLPPRRSPRIASLLDVPTVAKLVAADSPLTVAVAHSFFFAAERRGAST